MENYATERQIAAIKRAAEIRNKKLDWNAIEMLTSRKASQLIEELSALPLPLSDRQKEVIKRNCEILGEELPDFDKLEGGQGKSGSIYIANLLERVKSLPRKPTERQLRLVSKMEICLDIEPYVKDLDIESFDAVREFINKHLETYVEWEKECPTQEQIEEMKMLYNKMGVKWDYKVLMNTRRSIADQVIEWLYKEAGTPVPSVLEEVTLTGRPEMERGLTKEEISNLGRDKRTKDEIELENAARALCNILNITLEDAREEFGTDELGKNEFRILYEEIQDSANERHDKEQVRTAFGIIKNIAALTDEESDYILGIVNESGSVLDSVLL